MIQIQIDEKQIQKAQMLLKGIKDGAQKAVARALNHTIAKVQTRAIKEVRAVYNISVDELKNRMKANTTRFGSNMEVSLGVQKLGIPLIQFYVGDPTIARKLVRVKIKKARAKSLPGGFVQAPEDKLGVFIRAGDARYPIKRLYGPSAAQMAESDVVGHEVIEFGQQAFSERLEHEIQVILNGWANPYKGNKRK